MTPEPSKTLLVPQILTKINTHKSIKSLVFKPKTLGPTPSLTLKCSLAFRIKADHQRVSTYDLSLLFNVFLTYYYFYASYNI